MTTQKEPKEYRITNANVISTGTYWFPFGETTAPSVKDIEENFPLRSYAFDNTSDYDVQLILDPAPISSPKQWLVPSNKSRETDPADRLRFHNVAVKNNGAGNIAAGELTIALRNY
jgi:hypothetical protein